MKITPSRKGSAQFFKTENRARDAIADCEIEITIAQHATEMARNGMKKLEKLEKSNDTPAVLPTVGAHTHMSHAQAGNVARNLNLNRHENFLFFFTRLNEMSSKYYDNILRTIIHTYILQLKIR